ncbi:adenylate kinase family protein [Candidatus Woesearchaeota archaeon]|nr:adenylate kinase family protein [Candidatus Woesearchaeota archaeon]
MKKTIIVTGTPCTGKTTVAKKLAKKLGYEYIDVASLIKKNRLSEGYDRKRKCSIVDIKKLNRFLGKIIKNSKTEVVIDSHLSHYLPSELVRFCVVTKCNLKRLNMRLKKRGYPKHKIAENLECEIFDVCLNEAKESGHRVVVVETDTEPDYEKIIRKIKRIKK